MHFKGTIIITDPCYIVKDLEERLKEANIKVTYPHINIEDDIKAYEIALQEYHKLVDQYDDWKICEYGANMEKLGFTKYISKPTLYGDWSCTTFSTPDKDIKSKLEEYLSMSQNECKSVLTDMKELGSFCADAGMVSVFLLEEVLNYNSDFKDWLKDHSKCATIISDFDGNIQYYVDSDINAHIIGEGNINFFTIQTGF